MFYTKPWADVLIVLLIVVLFFGPKRLPTLGRSLGQGFREFKDGITGKSGGDEERSELNSAQPTQAPTAAQGPPAAAQAPSGQAPAPAPPPAQPPATPGPPAAVAAQPPSPPEQESAEVASSEQRS